VHIRLFFLHWTYSRSIKSTCCLHRPHLLKFYIKHSHVAQVKFLDLTLPQYWLPRYDWVLSTEVLEHIPAKFESVALDNICRAAGHGVVLSWAVPGRRGYFHVNNRPHTYVKEAMRQRGFTLDTKATLKLRRSSRLPQFKNIMVFLRYDLISLSS